MKTYSFKFNVYYEQNPDQGVEIQHTVRFDYVLRWAREINLGNQLELLVQRDTEEEDLTLKIEEIRSPKKGEGAHDVVIFKTLTPQFDKTFDQIYGEEGLEPYVVKTYAPPVIDAFTKLAEDVLKEIPGRNPENPINN